MKVKLDDLWRFWIIQVIIRTDCRSPAVTPSSLFINWFTSDLRSCLPSNISATVYAVLTFAGETRITAWAPGRSSYFRLEIPTDFVGLVGRITEGISPGRTQQRGQQFPRAQLPTHLTPGLQPLIRMTWTLDHSPERSGNQDRDDDTATCPLLRWAFELPSSVTHRRNSLLRGPASPFFFAFPLFSFFFPPWESCKVRPVFPSSPVKRTNALSTLHFAPFRHSSKKKPRKINEIYFIIKARQILKILLAIYKQKNVMVTQKGDTKINCYKCVLFVSLLCISDPEMNLWETRYCFQAIIN